MKHTKLESLEPSGELDFGLATPCGEATEEFMGMLARSPFGETPFRATTNFLDSLLADYPRRDFRVRLWDGTSWGTEDRPRFTLVVKQPEALRAMFAFPGELTLGEAYIYDDFDIEGDIEVAFDLADYLLGQERSLWERFDLGERLQKLPASGHPQTRVHPAQLGRPVHSKDRDRQAIRYHYDLPAEFFALWLDSRMIYSCAYFGTAEEDLDTGSVTGTILTGSLKDVNFTLTNSPLLSGRIERNGTDITLSTTDPTVETLTLELPQPLALPRLCHRSRVLILIPVHVDAQD